MGAVYRATDTQLGREVALKILPAQFVRGRQRLGRFQREAEVLASLNHPHISMIHGLEEEGEVRALVLELVEGPTLAERIDEGPIPVEEALGIALEIAQALEAAHEKGIIHRDLKPSNVKITPEGTVKVLDFGLAKALENEVEKQELANSPTLTLEATREGIVLGTAAYVSPEQARGREVDKRTDIWSFGLVLFEMLTGKRMYAGKSSNETLAAVIHQEPSLEELPQDTPWKIRELLERCLRMDSRMRLRDIGDARIAIEECLAGGPPTSEQSLVVPVATPLWRRAVPWMAVPLMAMLAWWVQADTPVPQKPMSRWELPAESGERVFSGYRHALTLSPDGTRLAFVSENRAAAQGSRLRIYLRQLDQWGAQPLQSDRNLGQPFFSPDGRWLGFWSLGEEGAIPKLKKIPLEEGSPTTICDCQVPFGASWGSDGTIVFACVSDDTLWRVSASGGEPEQFTKLDKENNEVSHRLPHMLPGGKSVLFTVLRHIIYPVAWKRAQIAVQSLKTGERKTLIEEGSDARYVPTGHLVFAREGTLMALPFDLASLTVTGRPVPVLERVTHSVDTPSGNGQTGAAQFSVSASGALAYVGGPLFPKRQKGLVWVYRDGTVEPIDIEPGDYQGVRLSPDELKVALINRTDRGNIWIYDLERATFSPQTFEETDAWRWPAWTPDGKGLALSSDRKGPVNLFLKRLDGDSESDHLFPSQLRQDLGSFSPDGSEIVFTQLKPETTSLDFDIWIGSLQSGLAKPLLESRFDEKWPVFSPNGHWLAYGSNESGTNQVYVRSYPGLGGKQQISIAGGVSPTWSGDGSELFYVSSTSRDEEWISRMNVVEITVEEGRLTPGKPFALFEGRYEGTNPARAYDVTGDGQRFLMVPRESPDEWQARFDRYLANKVSIVLNWAEELKRLAPTEN